MENVDLFDEGEREANAALIAAAPELLEACKELSNHANKYGAVPKSADKLWAKINSAIAKAESKQ